MLIKSKVKGKAPVPYTAEESLPFAVAYGAKLQNTKEKTHWVLKGSVKPEGAVRVLSNPTDKTWEASAVGTALLGFTDTKTRTFHKAKPHRFSVTYKSSKDHLGLPDVEVVSLDMSPVNRNPRDGYTGVKVAAAPAKVAAPIEGPKPVIETKKPAEAPKVAPVPPSETK